MLFHKQLTPEAASSLLCQLASYTQSILLQKGPTLPYQLAYDQIYQLCRNEKQQQVLETLFLTLRKTLPQVFAGLGLEGSGFLEEFAQLIERTEKSLEQVSNVCLYLDLNYCRRDGGVALAFRLNSVLLTQLFSQFPLIESLGKNLALSHISSCYQKIQRALSSLKRIDPQQEYFVTHFVKHYLPVLTKHYTQQSLEQFTIHNQSKQIEKYIKYASEKLQKQVRFLQKFWPQKKKCAANKQFIMKELYQIFVSQHKQEIYIKHRQQLFSSLTLQILQLFKHGEKSSDIQKHADWYNVQIKQHLSTIPLQNNTQFITQICKFYQKIMTMLQSTYNKFDIHYRSRFAFQEWINSERLQMPVRLNDYIGEYCLGRIEKENQERIGEEKQEKVLKEKQESIVKEKQEKVLERIGVVFVLMKEKNLFEKGYRRELVGRILNNFGGQQFQKQSKIISLMQKQCSQQFVKHIKPIIQNYKLKSSIIQDNQSKNSITQNEKSQSPLGSPLNTFLLNVQHWPYDQKNTSVTINQQMLKLTRPFTQSFTLNNKQKSLYYHPIVGVVTLNIAFLESHWRGDLIVNTCMANLLLHFLQTQYQPFQLKHFCSQTGYKIDQLYHSIKKLITLKVLINQGTQQSYKLAINQSFTHVSKTFDVLNLQLGNKFQAKPLQQLKADRKFMVQAIIVKIMKRLKNSDKQTILKEASPLIQKRGFNFNAKFVQTAIDRLVDKEFIRDYQDGRYGYIA